MRNNDPRVLGDREPAEEVCSGGIHASAWGAAATGDFDFKREHLV